MSIINNTFKELLLVKTKNRNEIKDDLLLQSEQEYNYGAASDASGVNSMDGSLISSDAASGDIYENDASIIAKTILNLLRLKDETKSLQSTLVTIGIFIIVLGILMNTLFNIIMIIRRRYTSNNVIMISMCTSYLFYLIFYCLKLSVYIKDISKYHIYDTLQEWEYGLFLCQFISGYLFTCKLISRFSILALCIKRIVTLFQAKNEEDDYLGSNKHQEEYLTHNADQSHSQTQQKQSMSKVSSSGSSGSGFHMKSKVLNVFIKVFEWPYLLLLILAIWLLSFLFAIPVYTSYKLTSIHNNTAQLCDSIYSFPEDTSKYALITFNYLIFGLILPSIIILMAIAIVFAIQCVYDLSYTEKVKSQTNILLVIIFLIHLITTLPPEVYKYSRLSNIKQQHEDAIESNLNNANFIEKTILDTISNPIIEARPYYYLQYLYISEFIIMPIALMIYYIVSTKKVSNICTLYVKCFDCHEQEDLLNRSDRNTSNSEGRIRKTNPFGITSSVTSSTPTHKNRYNVTMIDEANENLNKIDYNNTGDDEDDDQIKIDRSTAINNEYKEHLLNQNHNGTINNNHDIKLPPLSNFDDDDTRDNNKYINTNVDYNNDDKYVNQFGNKRIKIIRKTGNVNTQNIQASSPTAGSINTTSSVSSSAVLANDQINKDFITAVTNGNRHNYEIHHKNSVSSETSVSSGKPFHIIYNK